MKIFVTGVKGQLGFDVVNELTKRGHEAIGVDIDQLDITDEVKVTQMIKAVKPEAVIHCAAWTAVDPAEEEANKAKVQAVNVDGTVNIAKVCREIGCKMMYISTDYVFNGSGERPWEPDDERQPLSVYGQTKYEGELAVETLLNQYFIVRIAWVFGVNGKNFVKTMLNLGKTRESLSVVNDQIGTPTYTYDLSRLLVDMIETDRYGRYHVTNEADYISWYDFTCEIMRQASLIDPDYAKVKVNPVSSDAYPAKAKRPSNSRMDRSKLIEMGFKPLPSWQDALSRYLKEVML